MSDAEKIPEWKRQLMAREAKAKERKEAEERVRRERLANQFGPAAGGGAKKSATLGGRGGAAGAGGGGAANGAGAASNSNHAAAAAAGEAPLLTMATGNRGRVPGQSDEQLRSLDEPSVFFKMCSRGAAESMLNDAKPGSYVVRPSSQAGCLSLSYRRAVSGVIEGRVAHLLLIKTNKGWCKEDDQGKFFATVYELLKWISRSLYLLLDTNVTTTAVDDEEEEGATGLRTVILKPWRLFGTSTVLVPKTTPSDLVTPLQSAAYRIEVGEDVTARGANVLPMALQTEIAELEMRKKVLEGNVQMVEKEAASAPPDVAAQQKDLLVMLRAEVKKLDDEIANKERPYRDPQKLLGSMEICLDMVDDIYADEFQQKPHMNFIGATGEREGSDDVHEIVCVLRTSDHGMYKALRITRKGTERFSLHERDLKMDKKRDLHVAIARRLNETLGAGVNADDDGGGGGGANFYFVHNVEEFSKDLARIEEKHPQAKSQVKIALIYSTKEKPTGKDQLGMTPSTHFAKFLEVVGKKLSLKGWTGYRGDMGKSNEDDTYYAKWKGVEIIFHVSTMLSADAHRRLIGNDIAVIFFRDPDAGPLDLDQVDIGTVPQVHAVVQPRLNVNGGGEDAYQLAFFSRTGIKEYLPQLPQSVVFRPTETRDLLLCKMINGLVSAMIYSAPMNRLYFRPRGAALEDLVLKYPKETDKAVKQREKAALVARKKMRETHAGLPRQLVVTVTLARNFIEREGTAPSPYVVADMQEQEFKSEVLRKTYLPQWNAEFRFDLVGVEVDHSTVQFAVWDKGMVKDEFLGQCTIALGECLKRSKEEVVLPLQPRPGFAGDLMVGGELVVRFEAEMKELHMDGKIDLTQFDWYHGNLSGADAFRLVQPQPPGAFLVRTSTKRAGCFVITYKKPSGEVIHVLLEKRDDGWHGEGMQSGNFTSLSDVLRKYARAYSRPISNKGMWQKR